MVKYITYMTWVKAVQGIDVVYVVPSWFPWTLPILVQRYPTVAKGTSSSNGKSCNIIPNINERLLKLSNPDDKLVKGLRCKLRTPYAKHSGRPIGSRSHIHNWRRYTHPPKLALLLHASHSCRYNHARVAFAQL